MALNLLQEIRVVTTEPVKSGYEGGWFQGRNGMRLEQEGRIPSRTR